MKEIIIFGILTGITFFGFMGLLVNGIVRKRRKSILFSILILVISISLGITTAYKVITKSYYKVSDFFKPRTGDEIYTALFGEAENECLEIVDYQDQIVPKIDYAIWLHLNTCPKECARILAEFEYDRETLATKDWASETPYTEKISWWNPKEMGDTVFVYEYTITEGKNIRTLWISKDSTEVYCRDIFD